MTGQHLTFLKTRRDTDGKLLQVEVLLEPGGRVPRHVHARQEERVEVLAGAVDITVAGNTRTLNVGDTADVPRRKVHVVRNAADGETRFLLEVLPARRMEGAMRVLFAGANIAGMLRRRTDSHRRSDRPGSRRSRVRRLTRPSSAVHQHRGRWRSVDLR